MTKKAIAVFSGKIKGTVSFEQINNTIVVVNVQLKGLKPNKVSGFHIHEYGDLSQGCMGLGSHYNPLNKEHGSVFISGKNRHVGDLINNVISDSKGHVNMSFEDNMVKLKGKNSIIGRAIAIHKEPDDLGTGGPLPTSGDKTSKKNGNSGKMIACAVIGICSTC